MTSPKGPDRPFQLLFDDDANPTPSLPERFRAIYPGDWRIPEIKDRPYIYTNLAISRDGRISFNEPGLIEAGYMTLAHPHDRWMMALLRMRADAVMVGDTTMKVVQEDYRPSTECVWSAEYIYPPDTAAFTAQRKAEGYAPFPLLVILSLDGQMDFNYPCFTQPDYHVVLATTTAGAQNARQLTVPANVDIHDLGEAVADLPRLVQLLYSDYQVRHLLCEGGAAVLANMLDAGLVDEEFVTWCPTFVGSSKSHHRPSYTEGVPWMPGQSPYSKPLTLHRGDDYIFLRSRVAYPT